VGRIAQALPADGEDRGGPGSSRPISKYDVGNAPAIKRLVVAGAQLRPFSLEIMDAAYTATNELFTEVAGKNPMFKKLYDSMVAFRNEQYQWHQVCEATYDNYMIRQRNRA
jgi:TRAP-type mannitol/chloroaromatic compound transport system substrate-binding protein